MVTDEFLDSLPLDPGVYLMKDKLGKVIYVGKAKILRNRVRQYFKKNSGHSPKVIAMVSNIDSIEYILTNSETEALNLECSLIKKYRPKYNILLKDDKSYPYIKVTDEEFPRILLARQVDKDGGKYFGPYISLSSVRYIINIMRKTFKIRECNKVLKEPYKNTPCLNYHIKRCDAPCAGFIKQEEYKKNINDSISVLSGKIDGIIGELSEKMNDAAGKMEFEKAALYRDKIEGIKRMSERQIVVSTDEKDEDIVCLHKENGYICIQLLYVRGGKLTDKKTVFMNNVGDEDKSEIISAFLTQYYAEFNPPGWILVSDEPADKSDIENYLTEIRGKTVHILKPQRGDKYGFIIMARKNASEAIRIKEMHNDKNDLESLNQLKNYLNLDFKPEIIEAYDISNTAGENTVASMVVFKNGKPSKKDYRKFKIKTANKGDDCGAIKETIKRRLMRAIEKKDEKFEKLPDIIFVDGGKGQISAAKQALREAKVNIPVFGIVKDGKHRTRDITSEAKEYNIPIATKCFKLITNIQDEMHRVAISYHRHLRVEKNMESEIMRIPGIGKVKYKNLMEHFKTSGAIKSASKEELMKVKGITSQIADNIEFFYKKL